MYTKKFLGDLENDRIHPNVSNMNSNSKNEGPKHILYRHGPVKHNFPKNASNCMNLSVRM